LRLGSVSRGCSVCDRWRRRCRTKNTDRLFVARLSHSFLLDDNVALLNSRRDTGQPHFRILARSNEVAFPATRLRFLFFVHSRADYFVSDHREQKDRSRSRLLFLWIRLRHRVLEHGITLDYYRRSL